MGLIFFIKKSSIQTHDKATLWCKFFEIFYESLHKKENDLLN